MVKGLVPEASAIGTGIAGVDFGNIRNSVPSETISFHKDGATKAQIKFPLTSLAPTFRQTV